MLHGKRLQDYLVYQVLGTQKKPPQQQSQSSRRRKAQPRKGPPRNEAYKAWIRTLPSLTSGRTPCDACHTETGGMSMKASDETVVPLTREEHQEYHQLGKRAFRAQVPAELYTRV